MAIRDIRKKQKGKRGDVTDVIVFMIITVFLAVSFITVIFVNNEIKGVITGTELNDTSASKEITDSFTSVNEKTVQRGFAIFIGLLIVGIIISSFLVKIHPTFLFLYIIILAFTIFLSVFTANMYDKFTDVPEINAISQDQPMINFFMENLVEIVLAVGAISMIIVFSKIFGSPGGASPTPLGDI